MGCAEIICFLHTTLYTFAIGPTSGLPPLLLRCASGRCRLFDSATSVLKRLLTHRRTFGRCKLASREAQWSSLRAVM